MMLLTVDDNPTARVHLHDDGSTLHKYVCLDTG